MERGAMESCAIIDKQESSHILFTIYIFGLKTELSKGNKTIIPNTAKYESWKPVSARMKGLKSNIINAETARVFTGFV